MSDASKTYTEIEFSRIMAKAAELAGTSSSIARREDGLTMEDIKSIAAEVGLDPDTVVRAVRLVSDETRPSLLERIMGGTYRVQRDFILPGEFTDDRAERLLSSVRSTMETHGEGGGNGSGVSWSTGEVGRALVSAHGAGAGTRVQVAVDSRRVLLPFLTLGSAGLLATLYAAIAAGDAGFGNPYLILVGGGGITSVWVWTYLRRIAAKTQATVESLVEAIGDALDRDRAS